MIDTRPPPYALRERMLAALKRAVEIIDKHVPRDALGTNAQGDPDVPGGYKEWPLLDEELFHLREAIREAEERAGLDSDEDDDPPCCTRCHIVVHEPYAWAEEFLGYWLCESCGSEARKAEVL